MLTSEQIGKLRKILVERDKVLREKMHDAIRERVGRDLTDLETSGGDDSEQSIADLLEGVDTSMLSNEVEELLAIETAKQNIDNHRYGQCIVCNGPISFNRLLVLPSAQRCLPCQEQYELIYRDRPDAKL